MGCWGMGMTQSDEFCNIYDQFMDGYDQGKNVSDISKEILAQYHEEFDDEDGVMHDVYFALAKAEWMCCEQSADILQRVKEIIESGANIIFYEKLGADAKDLSLRQKKLLAFYESLKTPRQKPRKRCPSNSDIEKPFPPMEIGDCYAYKYDNGKRVVVILDQFKMPGWKEQVFCCMLKNTYQPSEVKKIDFLEQEVGCIGCYIRTEFLGKSNLQKVGKAAVPPNAKNQILGNNGLSFGGKEDFKKDYSKVPSLKLADLLKAESIYQSVSNNKHSRALVQNPMQITIEEGKYPIEVCMPVEE